MSPVQHPYCKYTVETRGSVVIFAEIWECLVEEKDASWTGESA